MKKALSTILAALLCLSLCACSAGDSKAYAPENYILETEYKDDFKIVQLNDIHLGNKDNRALHYDFLRLTINDADADMIVCVGDLFTFADKTVARELFAFLDSFGIPWTITFGNHDEQCYFSVDWVTDYLNNYGSNCIFRDIQDDDVYGNANFAINLTDGSDVVAQVIVMDSNRYNYGEYWGYDYIKDNQIEWYENLLNYTTQSCGKTVPSVMFFHIPLPEYNDAWDAAEAGQAELLYGEKNEKVCCPEVNTGLFDKIVELGSSKAVCCAHDHMNNFRVLYKGVALCYGINSTDRVYYDDNIIGAMTITVKRDGTFEFGQVYHSYAELD